MSGVIGFGLHQPPVQVLQTMDSITQKGVVPYIADQVLIPCPTLWRMVKSRDKKPKFKTGEGSSFVMPLMTQIVRTGGPYWGDMLLNNAVPDPIQPAEQQWRPYEQPISVPYTDIVFNLGQDTGLDFMKGIFQACAGSFLQILSQDLWNTTQNPISVDSIPTWVSSVTNTVAGINRSVPANSFWLPQPPVAGGGSSSPLTYQLANYAYQQATYGYMQPDYLTMGPTSFAAFQSQFFANIRYFNEAPDEDALQAGFRYNFKFNNAIVLQDRYVPANQAFMLNCDHIFPVFHKGDFFNITPWIVGTNQLVFTCYITLTWQITCDQPRAQVQLYNIE